MHEIIVKVAEDHPLILTDHTQLLLYCGYSFLKHVTIDNLTKMDIILCGKIFSFVLLLPTML